MSREERDEEEDLMPVETGFEALEAELRTEALLDEVDVRAAAAYEAACGASSSGAVGRPLRAAALRGERGSGARERTWTGMVRTLCLRKRRNGVFGVGGHAPVPLAAFEEPDVVRVKSAVMIEDSDSGSCHFHIIVNTTTSHSLTLINIQYQIIHRDA